MNIIEDSIEIDGHKLTLQTGKLANQATRSVYAQLGETCVLVTVTSGNKREDIDYLPLQVEYVEKLYAGGRIKGSRWVKREGRPSDDAILKARVIDRSIRPLFPPNYRKEIQIIITLLSVDGVNSPEILSAIATSAALSLSPIPWQGPISTIRVGYIKTNGEGSFIINPTEEEERFSTLDLVVSSLIDKAVMIEAKSEELSEENMLKAIKLAQSENRKIIEFIEKMTKKIKPVKEVAGQGLIDDKILKVLKKDYQKNISDMILKKAEKEFDDEEALEVVVVEVMEKYKKEFERKEIVKAIDYLSKLKIREQILKTKKRIDGRSPDEIRELRSETSILPRTHGSAIFERGETQVLSIVTLGAPGLEQLIESPEGEVAKRYIHHYYMPPYSVGETGRIGWPSRREIGHGALAEKAIEPVLPTEKEFPYTIRVVSEVLSSNGSTSMASACGSSLALMDAGVPIKSPVAGIAMGLMTKSDTEYVILTDIMGIEDFSGDMDFKVAGTVAGITGIQLDVKILGLTEEVIKEVLGKAKKARLTILESMNKVISSPRGEISKFAPKVVVMTPPQDKIGEIIGPGGKNIRSLIAKTQTDINVSDDGKVTITGLDKEKVDEAVRYIENITREVEIGEEFEGTVKRILPFGAFVEFLPGKEGLVHVSKMGRGFVRDPGQVVKIGQKVKVKVNQIDNQGRINLQMIA
ncbi:polyribonucleotide nucleotidyltransferase [Candidatus Roizmanbacteria bacterium RIFCSPHIGHO2_01_FULL_39_12c]|uniref:Polyribonucleotide nucleotidyltransferase n=1 Tax=Candidatus Roizmanbacteria bacterium RIFCSPHIGHO2_01_FULL_39_12c TaxID=1802031 RepID=A0A1F7GEL2_9BACT|nr:MAG: polyribonucleotide nucleotidyltransferase [Candidatus Roizmanbacteria bacterium RIFCSPHIGHO2_01_FULL_39_12c]OGK48041.1 MAG: polyribonucleotide nucleotidyltransferase [Candidatus Roizmanbacteria bacterium RIFCSPLOWO2_01_FULL_40_13]